MAHFAPHDLHSQETTRLFSMEKEPIARTKTRATRMGATHTMASSRTMATHRTMDQSETALRQVISCAFGEASPKTPNVDEPNGTGANVTYESYDERRQKGQRAAQALQKMLDQPPDLKTLTERARVKDLWHMTQDDQFITRIKGWIGLIVRHRWFDYVMGTIIMMNAIAIGIEQTLTIEKKDLFICEIAEHLFLTIYIIELTMNFTEEGPQEFVANRWLQLDCALVIIGITSTWIVQPILGSLEGFGALFVLRIVRLLRLARMVRLLHYKELWTLVRGFTNSASTMLYTSMILSMVLYGFACVAIEVITNNQAYGQSQSFTDIVDTHFCNLPRVMLTLLQFICMDSVSPIYTPLVIEDGFLIFYFFALILSVSIVLMNIVTAVIVNSALETTALDKEARRAYTAQIRKGITEELGRMFDFFDEDRLGTVSMKELQEAPLEASALLCKLTEHQRVEDIFEEIDANGDGELTHEEFCQGVLDIVSSEIPHEIRQMQTKTQTDFMRVFAIMERLEHKVDKGLHRLATIEKVLLPDSMSALSIHVTETEMTSPQSPFGEDQNCAVSPGIRLVGHPRSYKPPKQDANQKREQQDIVLDDVPPWASCLKRELLCELLRALREQPGCSPVRTSSASTIITAQSCDVDVRQPTSGRGGLRTSESEFAPLLASAQFQSEASNIKESVETASLSKPIKKRTKVVKRVARNAKTSFESEAPLSPISKSSTIEGMIEVEPKSIGRIVESSVATDKYNSLFEEDDDEHL